MPGFANLLTAEQIEAIVRYVRDEIDTTTYDVGSAGNTADDATTEG
jgi:mono/diheme cytochrome c family protein